MGLQSVRQRQNYPRQFWLLFWGYMISTVGSSMIWPFLTIYVSEKLGLQLSSITWLMTVNAFAGVALSYLSGTVIDRAGRKWVMVVSLVISGLVYFFMSRASTLAEFAVLQAVAGAFNPLYRVAADAMMADLIPPEQRVDAYSLMRLSNNVGVAIGPALGGFIASSSYTLAFYFATSGLIFFAVLMAMFARETLPHLGGALQPGSAEPLRRGSAEPLRQGSAEPPKKPGSAGYGQVLRDRPFMLFVANFTLTQIASTILWVLFSVYLKQNYGILENAYGWLPTTNAVLVLALQMWVTRRVKNFAPLKSLSFGTLIYGLALGSIALGQGYWAFWGSMVLFTMGEMILMPTSTTYTANLAPADQRGRYMSIYSLTWGIASGIGPLLGGIATDTLGPRSPWVGGMIIGLVSAAAFLLLARLPGKVKRENI